MRGAVARRRRGEAAVVGSARRSRRPAPGPETVTPPVPMSTGSGMP
ncbi:hypothetical protein I546_3902 [Mycobacterium kansasii 732]|nr:hypothetical protein I546_3902 [Mycobacterium kansasii 732]